MRLLVATPLAFLLTSTAANALYCSRPYQPTIPSAYAADYDRMERAGREVDDYVAQMNDYLSCLARESDDASSEAEGVIDEWNRAVRNFNNQ